MNLLNPTIQGCEGKTALCTVLSDPFVSGFAVLAHSLLRQHPGLDLPFHVIHHPELAPLAPESRELVLSCYPDIRFHEVDDSLYQTVWTNRDEKLRTPERLKSAFFVIEAFGLKGYDRVVALDSDMVVIGDLSPLFSHPAPFAATRAIDYDAERILDFFNTGVMVIGAPNLTGESYRAILSHRISDSHEPRKGKADQAILNDFFGPDGFTQLEEAYNVTKRKFPDDTFACVEDLFGNHMRILHFVAGKPWETHADETECRYRKLEAYWARLLREALDFDQLLSHVRVMHGTYARCARTLHHERIRIAKERHSLAKERLFRHQERLARIKDVRIQSDRAGRVISQVLEQVEELTRPAKGTKGLKRWISRILRSINRQRILANASKGREIWTTHRAKLEEKLTALEPKEDPQP